MILLLVVIIITSLALTMFSQNEIYAEQYKFNMTKELIAEGRVLLICMETEIYLSYCEDIYGSIDKPYGDKIK